MSCKLEKMKIWKLNKTRIGVYCIGGALLKGYVSDYCEDSFVMDSGLLVFYSAVISIRPNIEG